MKNTISVLLLAVGSFFNLHAQHQKVSASNLHSASGKAVKSEVRTAEFLGKFSPVSVDLNWLPIMSSKAIKHRSKMPDAALLALKQEKMLLKQANFKANETEEVVNDVLITPVLSANFNGNVNTGSSPMDNSLAISNGGKIVSVANTSIDFYSSTGTKTFSNSIEDFFNDPGIVNVCDPVVLYDSGEDKFIFFAQECSGDFSNSHLLICFSETNDPNGNWFKYKITGNPALNNTWFDYPKMAVSNNELYITGNSFTNSGDFVESLIYQIPKAAGFIGGSLNFQYWNNIAGSPFTILPVSYGQSGNYGPGCYFVASVASGSSIINLYEITDDMSSSTETLNHFTVSTTAYSLAANAQQSGTSTMLDNGDCRALSGFYLDGFIHFVFHSDFTTGFNGVNYNRLDLTNLSNTSKKFGLSGSDYSYPSVASFATSPTDKSVVIGFGKSSGSIFPEIRAVSCDNAMNFGNSILVKAGLGFTEYTAFPGGVERWGDYSGVSRKHNATNPTVWMNGSYGTISNDWRAYIAEITGTGSSGLTEKEKSKTMTVYPNPIYDEFITKFELAAANEINITVYDLHGKLVKNLYSGVANAGVNTFTFNKAQLLPGNYVLSIMSGTQNLKNEKIIIAQ